MSNASLQTVKVMVIDDEPFAQRFVTRVLNSIGIENLQTAENGAQAIEMLHGDHFDRLPDKQCRQ